MCLDHNKSEQYCKQYNSITLSQITTGHSCSTNGIPELVLSHGHSKLSLTRTRDIRIFLYLAVRRV